MENLHREWKLGFIVPQYELAGSDIIHVYSDWKQSIISCLFYLELHSVTIDSRHCSMPLGTVCRGAQSILHWISLITLHQASVCFLCFSTISREEFSTFIEIQHINLQLAMVLVYVFSFPFPIRKHPENKFSQRKFMLLVPSLRFSGSLRKFRHFQAHILLKYASTSISLIHKICSICYNIVKQKQFFLVK